jgi:hypothetical protein
MLFRLSKTALYIPLVKFKSLLQYFCWNFAMGWHYLITKVAFAFLSAFCHKRNHIFQMLIVLSQRALYIPLVKFKSLFQYLCFNSIMWFALPYHKSSPCIFISFCHKSSHIFQMIVRLSQTALYIPLIKFKSLFQYLCLNFVMGSALL